MKKFLAAKYISQGTSPSIPYSADAAIVLERYTNLLTIFKEYH